MVVWAAWLMRVVYARLAYQPLVTGAYAYMYICIYQHAFTYIQIHLTYTYTNTNYTNITAL